MTDARKTRLVRRLVLFAVAVLAGGAYAWFNIAKKAPTAAASNAVMVIAPYRYAGTWVFDDPAAGLRREPFVAGVPEMIDVLVKDVPHAAEGFRLTFSAHPFPGHQKTLTWTRRGGDGNYYRLDDPPMEGWLCPALFRYYEEAPKEVFVKAEPLDHAPSDGRQ